MLAANIACLCKWRNRLMRAQYPSHVTPLYQSEANIAMWLGELSQMMRSDDVTRDMYIGECHSFIAHGGFSTLFTEKRIENFYGVSLLIWFDFWAFWFSVFWDSVTVTRLKEFYNQLFSHSRTWIIGQSADSQATQLYAFSKIGFLGREFSLRFPR